MMSMLIKRLLGALPTMFTIIVLTFLMMRLTPGGAV